MEANTYGSISSLKVDEFGIRSGNGRNSLKVNEFGRASNDEDGLKVDEFGRAVMMCDSLKAEKFSRAGNGRDRQEVEVTERTGSVTANVKVTEMACDSDDVSIGRVKVNENSALLDNFQVTERPQTDQKLNAIQTIV